MNMQMLERIKAGDPEYLEPANRIAGKCPTCSGTGFVDAKDGGLGEACPDCLTKEECDASLNGMAWCTREKNHSGDHAAHGVDWDQFARWENK